MAFEPGAAAPARPVWGVASLLLAAGDCLAARFGAVAVRGELSAFVRAGSGHCYFTLKDADGVAALLRCAMFRRAASLLEFAPRDGMQVLIRGRIGLYEPRGELQLVVESLQLAGLGTLYEEFLRLRSKLEAEGLFDPARKRSIPTMPARLALVTSRNAAALHDVLTTLQRRAPQVEIVVVPCLVQGAEAPASLVGALQVAGRLAHVDAVLLVRGGGSLEDLWAFNDERVVRAVATCGRPVICGVGHETDATLSDLAADLRAPTPTAAAELAAPLCSDLMSSLAARAQALRRAVSRSLQRHEQRLDSIALRLGPATAAVAVQHQRLQARAQRLQAALRTQVPQRQQELDRTAQRLRQAARLPLGLASARLQAQTARLQALDPHAVLRRGFVWVDDGAHAPVVSVHALALGDKIRTVWADGHAWTRVESIESGDIGE